MNPFSYIASFFSGAAAPAQDRSAVDSSASSVASVPGADESSALQTKSAATAWAALWAAGNEGSFLRDKEIDRPYSNSVWLNAGIKLVTSQMTRVPFGWFTDEALANPAGDDGKRAAFWKRPATRAGEPVQRTDAIEALGGWGLLAGEMIVLLPESWMMGRDRREPFTVARPSRLKCIRERYDGSIAGWEYLDQFGRRELLLPAQVIRSVFWNPYDETRGLGAYEPAKVEVAGDWYAAEFARNMAASNGSQPTYITTDGPGLQKEQQDQITAALREKQRRIQNGDRAPVFLNGGLKVSDPQSRSVDAAFIQQRIEHRHAIAAALGIPMSMFDIAASYSTGAASDLYRLITCACEPFGQKVAELLARVEEARSGMSLWCGFKWSDHPIMQEARIARFDCAAKAWATGIPWEVLSGTHRLELPEFAGSDTGFLPFSVQPVATVLAAPEETTKGTEDTKEEPALDLVEQAKLLMNVRIVESGELSVERKPPATVPASTDAPLNTQPSTLNDSLQLGQRTAKARDKARVRLWQKHMAAQKPFTNKLHGAIGKVLAKHRRHVLDHMATLVPSDASLRDLRALRSETKGAIDFVFDLADFVAGVRGAFRTVIPNTLTTAGEQAAEEFAGSFTPEPDWVRNYLDQRDNLVKDASEKTYAQIKAGIQEGIDAGDTMAELSKRVKAAFQQADRGRCEVIAQTETATAFGVARQASMEQAGITHKEWLSAQDDRVRDTHAEVDGQIVGADECFTVAGVQMMHPCADGAPAEEVINCRCVAIGSLKLDPEDAG